MMNTEIIPGLVNGLIPAIIQDFRTSQVLMLGYMNKESLLKTLDEKKVCFYSRSKNRLWTKGESSGNFLNVKEVTMDCDQDTLLIKVIPDGPVCHTGETTCFGEKQAKGFLYELEVVIRNRIENDADNSYTNKLYKKGIKKVAQKLGEEATELVIEALDDKNDLFENEAADLLYHFLILLRTKGYELSDIENVLMKRH